MFSFATEDQLSSPSNVYRRAGDAETFGNIASRFRRHRLPGNSPATKARNLRLAVQIAAESFNLSQDRLRSAIGKKALRAKIICAVRMLTGESYRAIGAELGVTFAHVYACHRRHRDDLASLLECE